MSFDVSAKLIPKIISLSILPGLLLSSALYAAEDITVITADRIKSYSDKSTSDVRIITSEEIGATSSHTLPELLSRESDLSVVSSGPNGSNTSLFLRGTDSSHTLVVIDGVIMNDPSNPNRQFDIGRLSLNNIERIEILKGSQGLAYGSNAIGGVIVITTKKAKSKKLSGESYIDTGTFRTVNAGANFQKKILDNLGLSFGADIMRTRGFSAADEKFNPNAEKDGDQRESFDLGAVLDLSEQYSLDANIRYSHNSADLDKGGGAGSDDPNDQQTEEEIYSKVQLTKNWEAGNAQTKLAYNFSKHYRLLEVLYDAKHPQSSTTKSTGEIKIVSANHTYYMTENLTQNVNVDFQGENDQSGHYNQNLSGFLYHQYELADKIFNFGLRLDHNKFFDDHFTYKAAAGYKFESALLKLSYSTGFRAPSLNQLYDPSYGNKSLHPETSQSPELSFEKKWSGAFKTVSTLFYTKINNRLSYNPNTFVNINSGKAEMMGSENKLSADWLTNFNQSLSFTLLKTRDLNLGQKLARRPDLNIKNIFSYLIGNSHYFSYELSYTGKRNDVDNQGLAVKMDSYLLSNLNYRYLVNNQNEFYLKIKNLADIDYEEIYGFGTGGRAITVGAHYNY
ncbi:MAG: TonB-dependent receptor [Bacteriovorax sp.]|nr:TonB-dependent receptor [Bacteriovorax sp.]